MENNRLGAGATMKAVALTTYFISYKCNDCKSSVQKYASGYFFCASCFSKKAAREFECEACKYGARDDGYFCENHWNERTLKVMASDFSTSELDFLWQCIKEVPELQQSTG